MGIVEKLAKVQAKLKAPKNQRNHFGKYNYRSCEDILEAVKPLVNELGCVVTLSDDVVVVSDRIYVKATAYFQDEKETASSTALAREPLIQKGMNEAQITGSASSYARKYALNGLFAIDDTKDADATETHGKKSTLKEDSDEFNKVKLAIEKGYTIEQVKTKYSVSKEVEELLTKTK